MSGVVKQFEDLECWKEARILVRLIYQATSNLSFAKDFGLKDQIQRSAVSVMSNIAEGFETYSNQEFIRYLGISVRSCAEVQSHLYAALDIGYISEGTFKEISQQRKKCFNFIKAFLKYLRTT